MPSECLPAGGRSAGFCTCPSPGPPLSASQVGRCPGPGWSPPWALLRPAQALGHSARPGEEATLARGVQTCAFLNPRL